VLGALPCASIGHCGYALAALNLVEFQWLHLGGLLGGLVLLGQLHLHLYYGVVQVVVAAPHVGDGTKRGLCLVWHCYSFGSASAPLLEVYFLRFAPEESVDISLILLYGKEWTWTCDSEFLLPMIELRCSIIKKKP
jgi:hypothetical protein